MSTRTFETLREDVRTVFARDPAARSVSEVLFCYPGLHALWLHRPAHWLWKHRLWFPARYLSHVNRFLTGVEIHPGAQIGKRFFIDHGAGVVIGETAEIGDDVLLYQGVVLGGTTMEKKRRHPRLENAVTMGAGAVALGPITIGEGARIGAGSVVTKPVPPGATVVGVPGRILGDPGEPIRDTERRGAPNPVAEAIRLIVEKRDEIQDRVRDDERLAGIAAPVARAGNSRQNGTGQFHGGDGI
jgi:serine O-acetyltransferase